MSFAALMALSATQTREQQSVIQNQLLERQRREETQRKKRDEQERKQLELEKQRRIQHFDNLKREEERQKEKLEKEKALEAERQRREQAQLDALRYGPKKIPTKYPASNSQIRDQVRRRRVGDDDDGSRAPEALTREELRERKRLAEQRRMLTIPKRSSHHSSGRRRGNRLPGGAIDTTASLPSTASGTAQTTRERIAAIPPTLVKLNQVKRDLRSIDEIQTQLKNAKALEGDDARSFNEFFVDRKKEPPVKQRQGSRQGSAPLTSSRPATPVSKASTPVPSAVPKLARVPRVMPKATKSSPPSRASMPASSKKRSLSSRSISPPPKRRAVSLSEEEDYDDEDDEDDGGPRVRPGMIYQMMRGSRASADYSAPIFSDDEDDMEVDARILEKEEKMSARIAQREEAEAAAAEKRHEEEKLRRKKEKAAAALRQK